MGQTMRAAVLAAALVAGASYYANHWIGAEGPLVAAWKGTAVGLLALWAGLNASRTKSEPCPFGSSSLRACREGVSRTPAKASRQPVLDRLEPARSERSISSARRSRARTFDGWLIAVVLALYALGDVLIQTHGLVTGAVAFLAGHCVAMLLYLRNRRGPVWLAAGIALVVSGVSWALPADRGAAPGIAFYALGLGAMAGCAAISRFPRASLASGAALFVFSDLLIFAELGPLAGSALPGLLIWPTYFVAQALIAWSVVRSVR